MDAAVGLGKAPEDLRLLLGRHADARVLHRKPHALRPRLHTQHHAALVGELERIAQQVDQHLHQAMAVAADPLRQALRPFEAVIHRCALQARLEHGKRPFDRRA